MEPVTLEFLCLWDMSLHVGETIRGSSFLSQLRIAKKTLGKRTTPVAPALLAVMQGQNMGRGQIYIPHLAYTF